MKELLIELGEAVKREAERADAAHGVCYNSPHEGYAVLMEEIEEARDAARLMMDQFCREPGDKALWDCVRGYGTNKACECMREKLEALGECALQAAAECVQVAAVCSRMLYSMDYGGPEWKRKAEEHCGEEI